MADVERWFSGKRALLAPEENLGSVFSTHIVVHNDPQLQFKRMRYPSDFHGQQAHKWYNTHIKESIHKHKIKLKILMPNKYMKIVQHSYNYRYANEIAPRFYLTPSSIAFIKKTRIVNADEDFGGKARLYSASVNVNQGSTVDTRMDVPKKKKSKS